MTIWRWPSPAEERADFAHLRRLLGDEVARAIAAMPLAVPEPIAPLALRADAWCFRVDQFLAAA